MGVSHDYTANDSEKIPNGSQKGEHKRAARSRILSTWGACFGIGIGIYRSGFWDYGSDHGLGLARFRGLGVWGLGVWGLGVWGLLRFRVGLSIQDPGWEHVGWS